jgi:hypothetical protein
MHTKRTIAPKLTAVLVASLQPWAVGQRSTKYTFAVFLAAFAFIGVGAPAATASTSVADMDAVSPPKPMPDSEVSPDGLWWPEVKAYVTCSGYRPTFSGAAWDLAGNSDYKVDWSVVIDGGGGWGMNTQYLRSSPGGFLTTSTFYGGATRGQYSSFWATMYLYKDGQLVGQNTGSCNP